MPKAKTPKTKTPRVTLPADADIATLRPFCPADELNVIAGSAEHVEIAARVAEIIRTMPISYQQENAGAETVAHLHYFNPSSDFYITEKDAEGDGTAQAFGWSCLNGDLQNAELGYISIAELVANGVELDLHFEPRKLTECIEKHGGATPGSDVALVETGGAEGAIETDSEAANDSQATSGPADVVEQLPDVEFITLPVAKLRAAALVAARKDVRYYLNGVLVQCGPKGAARIVSTDGHRLLVISHDDPGAGDPPAWLAGGIILGIDALNEALAVCAKHGEIVTITHGAGRPNATLTCGDRFASFDVSLVGGKFPDFDRILAGIDLTNEGGDVLQAATLNREYLKSATMVAAALGANGVQSFAQHADKSAAFLFAGAPDAVMVIMPLRNDQPINERTVALLPSAVKASIGALKAHVTRCKEALKATKDEGERRQLQDREKSLSERIAQLTQMAATALPAPVKTKGGAAAH